MYSLLKSNRIKKAQVGHLNLEKNPRNYGDIFIGIYVLESFLSVRYFEMEAEREDL